MITVPAYFGGAERAATKAAGEIAGLNVLGILNEPTAVAIAYCVAKDSATRTVLVDALGGGAFDVNVVEASPTNIRAAATDANRELGGIDWDDHDELAARRSSGWSKVDTSAAHADRGDGRSQK